MPRKPSTTMLTYTHSTGPGLRAAVHVLPAPTPEGMTHYTTFQRRAPAVPGEPAAWRPMSGASYARSLLIALRTLRRAGYVVPPETAGDPLSTV